MRESRIRPSPASEAPHQGDLLRRWLLIPLLWTACAGAQTYYPIQGYCEQGGKSALTQALPSTNSLQGIIPGCTITVYLTGTTTPATLYSNSTGTPLSNPFTANVGGSSKPGYWIAYVAAGQQYDVVGSGGGGNPACTVAPNCYPVPVTLAVASSPSAGGPSGTGVSGYLPLWTGTASLGDSLANYGVTTTSHFTFGAETDFPDGLTGNVTGHASLDLPLAGGTLSGPLAGPSAVFAGGAFGNGVFATTGALGAQIAAQPSGGTLLLPPGVYTLGATTISNPIKLQCLGPPGAAQIQITGSPNVGLTISTGGFSIDGCDISGATGQLFNIVGQSQIWITRNTIHGAGTQAYSGNCSADIYIQGGSDIWITDNTFTGNGISTPSGASYDICANFDISSSNYSTQRLHVNDNWFYGNNTSFNINPFNCDYCEAQRNTIDQNNVWDGATQAYAINFYNNNEGICLTTIRSSNVVTCTFTGSSQQPAITYPNGVPVSVSGSNSFGTAGSDFRGVFTLTSSSGGVVTWNQTGPNDSAGSNQITVNFGFGHVIVANNHIRNVAGNAIYLQSSNYDTAIGNVIDTPALQLSDSSLCQSGISSANSVGNAITGNTITNSGKAGICLNGERTTATNNTIDGATHFGYYLRGLYHSALIGGTIANSAPAGIGGDVSGSTPDAIDLDISNVDINAEANKSGYSFTGPDSQISITGGSVQAPPSATSPQYGIIINNANATSNLISGVNILCTADQSASSTPLYTLLDGIYYGGTNSVIQNNTITGCKYSGSAFGIFEASSGANNTYRANTVALGQNGIELIGTDPHAWFNNVWNNSTPIYCAAATNPDCTQNLISQTGTLPVSSAQLATPFTTSQIPPVTFTAGGTLTAISTSALFGAFYVGHAGTTFTNLTVVASAYTCSAQPTINLIDCGTSSSCASPTTLANIAVPTTANQFNGTAISVTPTVGHTLSYQFSAGTCTALSFTAAVQ